MVRICIPTMGWGGLEEEVSEHFGRAPTFTIIELETGRVEVVPNAGRHGGGGPPPAQILKNWGVDVLICSGIGPRAANFLKASGIEVYYGRARTVREALEDFKAGRLSAFQGERNTCPEHRGL
ncbi:MAG: dinitrogenase iron-molybdenum cofactor biosynthesis protein [Candidatus Hecatellales archaeon]|nr:MAG: dinitrogenase iron-molybdenum cofactor biosynthesis protein [Candidatus Hecatellales archaeon]